MKGFGGVPGNMQALFKQAQKMQQQLKQVQEESAAFVEECSAGGGVVKAAANGKNQLVSLTISKDVVNPDDIEMLTDLILAAANEALEKVQAKVKTELEKVTGGVSIPGL